MEDEAAAVISSGGGSKRLAGTGPGAKAPAPVAPPCPVKDELCAPVLLFSP